MRPGSFSFFRKIGKLKAKKRQELKEWQVPLPMWILALPLPVWGPVWVWVWVSVCSTAACVPYRCLCGLPLPVWILALPLLVWGPVWVWV